MISGNVINTLLFIVHSNMVVITLKCYKYPIVYCTFQYGCVYLKMRISATSNFQIAADDKIISFHLFFFKLSQFSPVI